MTKYPLAVAVPVLYVWDDGDTGHVAWDIKGLYSSYRPVMKEAGEVLGRKRRPMRDVNNVQTLIVKPAPVAGPQSLERDIETYGQPTSRVPVSGLNPKSMQMLARQLYRSGRGERPQQLSYVLDTVRIQDSNKNNTPYIQTRSNCVTHTLSLFCAGLSGVTLSEQFLLLYPEMAMGPQANDFSRYFRSTKVYAGEEKNMFTHREHVFHVRDMCMAFNLHHPGTYQPPIKYS